MPPTPTVRPCFPRRFRASYRPEALRKVVLSPLTADFLRRQLYLPGRVHGGLLFGHQRGGTLQVLVAGSGGWSGRQRSASRGPLEIDGRFALGWGEAVEELLQGHAAWCGHWLVQDDENLSPPERFLPWFWQGVERGLIDERRILLAVGFNDGVVEARALALNSPLEPASLPCTVAAGRPGDTLRALSDLLNGPH